MKISLIKKGTEMAVEINVIDNRKRQPIMDKQRHWHTRHRTKKAEEREREKYIETSTKKAKKKRNTDFTKKTLPLLLI